MANEAIATFFDRLAEDDALRDAYAASLKRATENAMLETARSAGLEFTVEELRDALEERASELSEDQLNKVAGGVGIFSAPTPAAGDYDRPIGQYRILSPVGHVRARALAGRGGPAVPNLLLTTVCNRRCPYCFAAGELGGRRDPPFLSLADLDWALAFIARSGVRDVGLLGGEPTLHPCFPEVIDRVSRAGIRAQVFTNGLGPPDAIACLESAPVGQVPVTINVNGPADAPGGEHARVRAVLTRLGPRAGLGFNIYREDADLEFLIHLIEEAGGARRIRLGVAHPIVGAANRYLPLSALRRIAPRLLDFVRQAGARKIAVTFDCGLPRCAFSDDQLAEVARTVAGPGFACSPAVDIGPGLDVWRCFPLFRTCRANLRQFDDYADVVRHFSRAFGWLSAVGALPECAGCRHLHRRECGGGCLAHALRAEPVATRRSPGRTDPAHHAEVDARVRRSYDRLTRYMRDEPWFVFMNHGYAPAPDEASRFPVLSAEDERWRHQVYLYLFLLDAARRCSGGRDLSGLSVVDVGCGRGGGLSAMKRYGGLGTAVGVDPCEQHVAFSRRCHEGQGMDFRVGAAARLPVPDASVDVVSSVESSHTYPDVEAFLREARRVLVAGGLMLLADCRTAGSPGARLAAQVRRSGMTVLHEEDITARVSEACTLDVERLPRLIGRPKAALPAKFARAKRKEYASGAARYFAFVARNP